MVSAIAVLYDADCPTCQRAKAWLEGEVQLVPITFVAAGSEEARRRFPSLDHDRSLRDVTVLADDGSVFHKDRAWIVILWSLARWRDVADHFAPRLRRPILRLIASLVDRRRRAQKARRYGVERAEGVVGEPCVGERCSPWAPPVDHRRARPQG
jgi:predicted DCC family thiol-disulfide oxidoreductase YuxK